LGIHQQDSGSEQSLIRLDIPLLTIQKDNLVKWGWWVLSSGTKERDGPSRVWSTRIDQNRGNSDTEYPESTQSQAPETLAMNRDLLETGPEASGR
jgi:hypothetical protein